MRNLIGHLGVILGAGVIGALSGCASQARPAPSVAAAEAPGVRVEVMRDGDRWSADYVLDRDAPVWAFQRSALMRDGRRPWRPRQWTVETPGVVMERRGFYDVLRSVDGGPVPRRLRLRLTPAAADLEADYDPALVFTGGAVALYTDHFNLLPLASTAEAEALPADLNGVDLPGEGPAEVTWRDRAGPVLFRGERHASVTERAANSYILFGQAGVVEGRAVTTVIDTGLPAWIGEEIQGFSPRVFDYYTGRLGPKPGDKPMVMVSWNGPSSGVSSMGGSVMPGLISMSFEGERVTRRSPDVLWRARWFVGHEAAHFWLGQAVRYEFRRDAWITEGGADLMAVRALKALDPAYDDRQELQREVDDCISLTRGRGVSEAAERGEHRAYYACGAVFAMVAEAAQKRRDGGDWFDFLRPLIDANREDGVLSRPEWLAALRQASGDPSLIRDVERLLDEGATDPAAVIARLFERTGVTHRRDGDVVRLI